MMRETGSRLTQQATHGERYPKLGNMTNQTHDVEQLPVSRYSSQYKITRKEISTPEMRTPLNNVFFRDSDLIDPFHDDAKITERAPSATGMKNLPSNLSASAAAVEKSTRESKGFIEPRPTRTSSLRARLSVGQIVKDDQAKVVGFTDFTAPPPSPAPSRTDSYRARKEAQARAKARTTVPLTTSSSTLRTKSSRDSMGGNRAPAKLVAGSRRPVPPRRPGSRGSTRSDSRASSPSTASRPPSRAAPPVPTTNIPHSDNAEATSTPEVQPRKSSIPIPQHNNSTSQSSPVRHKAQAQVDASWQRQVKMIPRDEFGIFADRTSTELVDHLKSSEPEHPAKSQSVMHQTDHALESIQESPQHAYQFKRLSVKSPEFGPTLSISPFAERYIMGPHNNKENLPPPTSKEKTRLTTRTALQHGHSNMNGISRSGMLPERPLSIHDLPSPRTGIVDPEAREKKTRSADLRSSSLQPTTDRSHSQRSSNEPKAVTSESSTNDPFNDAPKHLGHHFSITASSKPVPKTAEPQESIAQEAGWIHPLARRTEDAPDGIQNVNADFMPVTIKEHIIRNHASGSKPAAKDVTAQDHTVLAKDFAENIKHHQAPHKASPFTPYQPVSGPRTSSAGSYPPRSSSRLAQPDYTHPRPSPPTPVTTEKSPQTPSKEYNRRQNNLGTLHGHGSSQVDITHPTSKRDSTAQDSHKSQSSLSKGVLSNFKGLFHKRSSDTPETKNSKKPKGKVSITSNGSPSPPISEINPVHRPTLSSRARQSSPANAPKTATPAQTATPPLVSPLPTDISTTTTLAMQILDLARKERSSPQKEKLLELGKIMVDAITQARDAEKAVEEARQALRKAEAARWGCVRALGEVGRLVEGFRGRELGVK